jgi:sensor histidine kinase YesM
MANTGKNRSPARAGEELLGSRFASGVLVALAAFGRELPSRGSPPFGRARNREGRLESALVDLSRVFYYAEGPDPIAPLREELDFAERYLLLQSLRFDDRLRYRVSSESGIEELPVSRFALFSLLERAVAESLESSEGQAFIEVEATRKTDGMLELRVSRSVSAGGPRETLGVIRAPRPTRALASTHLSGSIRR